MQGLGVPLVFACSILRYPYNIWHIVSKHCLLLIFSDKLKPHRSERDVEGAVPYILPRLLNTKKLIRYVRQALLHALTSEALNIILGKQLVSVFRIRINSAVVPIAIV